MTESKPVEQTYLTNRRKLSTYLKETFNGAKIYDVYPSKDNIQYPSFKFSLEDATQTFASNDIYRTKYRYKVMYITPNPKDPIIDQILSNKGFDLSTIYETSGLTHVVTTIYY